MLMLGPPPSHSPRPRATVRLSGMTSSGPRRAPPHTRNLQTAHTHPATATNTRSGNAGQGFLLRGWRPMATVRAQGCCEDGQTRESTTQQIRVEMRSGASTDPFGLLASCRLPMAMCSMRLTTAAGEAQARKASCWMHTRPAQPYLHLKCRSGNGTYRGRLQLCCIASSYGPRLRGSRRTGGLGGGLGGGNTSTDLEAETVT